MGAPYPNKFSQRSTFVMRSIALKSRSTVANRARYLMLHRCHSPREGLSSSRHLLGLGENAQVLIQRGVIDPALLGRWRAESPRQRPATVLRRVKPVFDIHICLSMALRSVI